MTNDSNPKTVTVGEIIDERMEAVDFIESMNMILGALGVYQGDGTYELEAEMWALKRGVKEASYWLDVGLEALKKEQEVTQ